MFPTTSPTLLFLVIAGVTSMPHFDDPKLRSPRSPEYSSSSSSNSGSIAFSSSGTSVIPGPGGSGSFSANSGIGVSHPPNSGYGIGTYAGNYGYGNDVSNYVIPNSPSSNLGGGGFGGGGQSGFGVPGYGSGFGGPGGLGGGYGFGGFRGGSGGFGGSGAGAGSFAGTGGGYAGGFAGPSGAFASTGGFPPNFGFSGFSMPPFMPFDFTSFLQQSFANAAAQEEFIRKQSQAHGGDVSSNEVGGVGANAFGQIGPQGGYGAASVHPAPADGINMRFGGGDRTGSSPNSGPVSSVSGEFPPPQGNFQGISTFASSGQSDVNGKKTGYKTSSVSVNDNGKVTTYTAHDP